MLSRTVTSLTIAVSILGLSLSNLTVPSAIAQETTPEELERRAAELGCEFFKEVSTGQTQIRKKIQVTLLTRNNWNTDFAVPTGTPFDFYVAIMTPENDANYQVSIHLKYPQNRSDTVYDRSYPMERGRTYTLPFQSPTGEQPYQVNFRVGGANNNAYNIAVVGCPPGVRP
ncbi:MAG: hypothetical protein AB4290_13580 [Spirulina sp.]